MRSLMDDIRSRMPSGVAALFSEEGGKANIIVYVSKDLHDRFTAPSLIKQVAPLCGGSGGGRPDMAQAGGTNPAGIGEAMARLKELLASFPFIGSLLHLSGGLQGRRSSIQPVSLRPFGTEKGYTP